MKATHDLSATPSERYEIHERLNRSYQARESRFRWLWQSLGLKDGMHMLDVACGSGVWMRSMAKEFPRSSFLGVDLAEDFLEWAEEETRQNGFQNISYRKADIKEASRFGAFDVVHIGDLLAGLSDPESLLKSLSDALVPDGILIVEDIDIDLWTVSPPDQRWDEIIKAIQTRGKRHAARELAPIMDSIFKDIQVELISKGSRFDDPGKFSTLHTFLPDEVEQKWVLDVVRELAVNAQRDKRFGYVSRVVITGRK